MLHQASFTRYEGGRFRLLDSPERLGGEFIIRAYRFAPTTGSLESTQGLLLLFTSFVILYILEKSYHQSQAVLFSSNPF
jgi:hypothetical protein